jgi:membrane-bound lytic murein transglycosylase B
MRIITHTLILGSVFLLTACGSEETPSAIATETPAVKETTPAPTPSATPEHGRSYGNQPTISTSLSLASVTLNIVGQGTLKPMSQYRLNIALVAGTPGAIVRLWIGEESGIGSVKSKANGHVDHYHASAIVP